MRQSLVLAVLILLSGGAALAQVPPHPVVVGPFVYSDEVTVVPAAECTWEAYITARPGAVINQSTIGCDVYDDPTYPTFGCFAYLELSAFPAPSYAAGETLVLTVTGDGTSYGGNSETESFEFIVTGDPMQLFMFTGPDDQGQYTLPVELTTFSAEPSPGVVTLRWETASEVENVGFNVLRGTEREGAYAKINEELIPGAGTSTEHHTYRFVDEAIDSGLYFYKLEAVATNGDRQYSEIIEVRPTPAVFALASGYPNPMIQSTEIAFQVPRESTVSLRVYNMAGREVSVLQQGTLQAGYYAKTWNGADADGRPVGNGVYFVRMDAQGFNATKKLVVLR